MASRDCWLAVASLDVYPVEVACVPCAAVLETLGAAVAVVAEVCCADPLPADTLPLDCAVGALIRPALAAPAETPGAAVADVAEVCCAVPVPAKTLPLDVAAGAVICPAVAVPAETFCAGDAPAAEYVAVPACGALTGAATGATLATIFWAGAAVAADGMTIVGYGAGLGVPPDTGVWLITPPTLVIGVGAGAPPAPGAGDGLGGGGGVPGADVTYPGGMLVGCQPYWLFHPLAIYLLVRASVSKLSFL